jgi:CBS domain-containing protein
MLAEPGTPLMSMLVWLGYINIGLAIFNLIPGFPMDGGRVLRAAVWKATGDGVRATRIASLTGQIVAAAFIVLGLAGFLRGGGIDGLWIAFIGWFLLMAARSTYVQAEVGDRLRGVRASDLMVRDFPLVDGRANLQTLADDYLLLPSDRRYFVAVDHGQPAGLLTTRQIDSVDRARWPSTSVRDVMLPLSRVRTVSPETLVSEALDWIASSDMNELPVMSNGRLAGIMPRDRVLLLVVPRRELDM